MAATVPIKVELEYRIVNESEQTRLAKKAFPNNYVWKLSYMYAVGAPLNDGGNQEYKPRVFEIVDGHIETEYAVVPEERDNIIQFPLIDYSLVDTNSYNYNAQGPETIEGQMQRLRRVYDQNLISKAEYRDEYLVLLNEKRRSLGLDVEVRAISWNDKEACWYVSRTGDSEDG